MTSLITLPIRLPLEITYRAAKLGVGVVQTVAGILGAPTAEAGGSDDAADRAHAAEGGGSDAPWPVEEAVSPYVAEPIAVEEVEHVEALVDFDAPSEEELAPAHVDSEPALAYESGPADDVGAQVHVDAPWDGYDRMRAADIVDRLQAADEATRAVVRLYEAQGKARSSVLAATG